MKRLNAKVSMETFDMVVRRSYVLKDALKRVKKEQFDATKKIQV